MPTITIRLPSNQYINIFVNHNDNILTLKTKFCKIEPLFICQNFHLHVPGESTYLNDDILVSLLYNYPYLQLTHNIPPECSYSDFIQKINKVYKNINQEKINEERINKEEKQNEERINKEEKQNEERINKEEKQNEERINKEEKQNEERINDIFEPRIVNEIIVVKRKKCCCILL